MNKSKCPVCGSTHMIKNGKHKGVQTYKCCDCGYRFRNSKLPTDDEIWHIYQDGKQTVKEISASLGTSCSTIKRRLRNITINWEQPSLTGSGYVHLGATYWGRNNGILLALDDQTGKVLYLAFINHERISDYTDAVTSIEARGYKVKGIIIDGIKNLFKAFSGYKYWFKVINNFFTKKIEK